MRFFHATCTLGLEAVLADELTALNALHVQPDRGGVRFQGDLELALRAVLWVRSASRITERLFRNKPAHDPESLYESVRGFDWRGVTTPDLTVAVQAKISQSNKDPRLSGASSRTPCATRCATCTAPVRTWRWRRPISRCGWSCSEGGPPW